MAPSLPVLTSREEVLLWLAHLADRPEDDPAGRTQAGLAQATGLDRGHVSRTVAPLVSAGLLAEEGVRVPGFARKLKAYHLTRAGEAEAGRLAASLRSAEVVVRHGAGPAATMRVEEVIPRLPVGVGLWGVVRRIAAEGHVDLGAAPAEPVARPRFLQDMADAPPEGAFVGREREVDQFSRWLGGALPVFVVEGPGGVGKSTLVAHGLRRAALRRHVLWVRLWERSTLESLWERVEAHVVALGRQRAARPESVPDAWADAVVQRLKGLPVLWVLDDLQKASPLLREGLIAVVRRLTAGGSVRLVLVGREVDLPAEVARVVERRRLHPLSDQEADRLLAERGVNRVARGPIIAAAQGSPLFLQLLAQSGDPAAPPDAARRDFGHFLRQDLASGLDPAQVEALTVLSALRVPVGAAFFQRLGVGSPGALADLVQASLVQRRADGRFEMHDLVRSAFYDGLGFEERRRLHARLSQVFRPSSQDPTRADWSEVTEFLHHLVQAGRRDEAVRWVLRNQTRLMARAQALFQQAPASGQPVGA